MRRRRLRAEAYAESHLVRQAQAAGLPGDILSDSPVTPVEAACGSEYRPLHAQEQEQATVSGAAWSINVAAVPSARDAASVWLRSEVQPASPLAEP